MEVCRDDVSGTDAHMETEERGCMAKDFDLEVPARECGYLDLIAFHKNELYLRGQGAERKLETVPSTRAPHSRILIEGIRKGRWGSVA